MLSLQPFLYRFVTNSQTFHTDITINISYYFYSACEYFIIHGLLKVTDMRNISLSVQSKCYFVLKNPIVPFSVIDNAKFILK